ncbi:hypothetical protein ACOMHN_010069 [Nucella lapillus]
MCHVCDTSLHQVHTHCGRLKQATTQCVMSETPGAHTLWPPEASHVPMFHVYTRCTQLWPPEASHGPMCHVCDTRGTHTGRLKQATSQRFMSVTPVYTRGTHTGRLKQATAQCFMSTPGAHTLWPPEASHVPMFHVCDTSLHQGHTNTGRLMQAMYQCFMSTPRAHTLAA